MSDLSREVRGGRKSFYDDPDVDRLLAIVTRLLEEHWALRERYAALEKLLVEKQVLGENDVEEFEFSEADSAALDAASAKLIRDVLGAARNIES